MKFAFVALLLAGMVLFGCLQSYEKVSDVVANPDNYKGEINLQGEVVDRLVLGGLSGFTLRDDSNATIAVRWSGSLPAAGQKVRVSGVVMRTLGALGGPAYLDATKVDAS
ncbi:hypothetical protein H0O03_02415 [Candidatus Micrarchaeota archaeon]|nr:hypothetical protein [Candidatus Micrarchaeota archaeon]